MIEKLYPSSFKSREEFQRELKRLADWSVAFEPIDDGEEDFGYIFFEFWDDWITWLNQI